MEKQRNNRKQINRFLVELDNFLVDNFEFDNTVGPIFTFPFFANASDKKARQISLTKKEEKLSFKILDRLCNKTYTNRQNNNPIKARKDILSIRQVDRTSSFVQRVGYGLRYKLVKDISYEHIFKKMAIENRKNIPYLETFSNYMDYKKLDLKEFLIPEDYNVSSDLIIYLI